jgi:hypothetical protein
MVQVLKRNTVILMGILLCGLLCVRARPFLINPRGAMGPTVLQADSWIWAAFGLVLFLALAAIVAVAVGRMTNAAVGLFVLGAGVFALAGRLSTVRELAFSEGSLGLVALETLLMTAVALAASVAMFRLVGPLSDIHPRRGCDPEPLAGRAALIAAGAGVVALPVVWLLAQSPMNGQAIGATFFGGVAAGLVARLMQPHAQPMLVFASPILFGALGHFIAAARVDGGAADAYVRGTLGGLSMPMPLDFLSGTLMGVAVGLGWARSFLHHEHDAAGTARG